MNKWPVPERVSAGAQNELRDMNAYREAWMNAAADPSGFWLSRTKSLIQWMTPPERGLDGDYRQVRDSSFTWFGDGTLNVTESCLDRHAQTTPDKTAILWEGDAPDETQRISYSELLAEVSRTANALKGMGIQKGDRVIIYMGMVPHAAVAMLACARIGAIHSVVFGGFSAEALRDRVRDCGAEVILTQDVGVRGGRHIPLKATVDAALEGEHGVRHVVVYRRSDEQVDWTPGRDLWWHEVTEAASADCPATPCAAEDPLFILYTSGSTGRPKGLVHTCGGYITYAAYTHRNVFDLREDDVYACVADVGWITGHTYIVYGPLANGATTVMFESTPLYPDAGRYWDMVERHGITLFYTAPTAIRALAAQGDEFVTRYDRSSLRVLGTVGEPINPEAWRWYHEVVGEGRCNIVDTWWQTETGGMCISPIAPATQPKPGSATLPLPGIHPKLVNQEGHEILGPGEGYLCMRMPWPGQARTVWGDHDRYVATYFSTYPGLYFTGDGCRRDKDGYYWITGRVDDVLNVSGHRMGTAEFESAILAHDAIAECAVVGYPHELKGQGVYAMLVPQPDHAVDDSVLKELQGLLRSHIGAHAKVDQYQVIPGLPKTRSGKVMRRILRKIVEGRGDELGDVSTLADPSVVDAILQGYRDLQS